MIPRPSPYSVIARSARILLVAGAAVVIATCTDSPTGVAPGSAAHLALAPSFARGVSLAGTSARVDTVRITLRKPGATEIVKDTVVPFPANADSLTLSISVPVTENNEQFQAQMRLTSGSQLLFDGNAIVTAMITGGPLSAPPPPAVIPMVYVGPGAGVASISVSPRDTVLTFGDSVQFRVTARDSSGADASTFLVAWSTSDTSLARVSETGRLTAPASRGPIRIRVRTPNGIRDSATVLFVPRPTRLVLESGDGQTGVVNQPIGAPIVARVLAADDLGVPGTVVRVRGTGPHGGTIDSAATTDIEGRVRLQPRLGENAGLYTLTLTAASLDTLMVTATAAAGAPVRIGAGSGDGQVGIAGSPAPSPLVAKVRDAFGNAVSGARVRWFVLGGAGTLADTSSVTDTAGNAQVIYTFGALASDDSVSAILAEPAPDTSRAVFRLSSRAGAAQALAKHAGDGQTATVATQLAVAPAVIVKDRLGNAVPGARVAFAVVAGGGSLDSAVVYVTTNASGVAAVPRWTLGTIAGVNTLAAAIDSTAHVTFSATGVAGSRAAIVLARGEGRTAAAGTATDTAPAVRVTDTYGNGIQGARVRFVVTGGGGSVGADTAVVTDSSGIAAVGGWTLGGATGPNELQASTDSVTATVVFHATAVSGAPFQVTVLEGADQVGVAGSVLYLPVRVRLTDAHGNPIAGVAPAVSPVVGGGAPEGAVPATDADGVTTISYRLGATAGVQSFMAGSGAASATIPVHAARLIRNTLVQGTQLGCRLDGAGATSCWGSNRYTGQLGDPAISNDTTLPVPVSGAPPFVTIATGQANSIVSGQVCGLTASGQAYCWGNNGLGTLGVTLAELCEALASLPDTPSCAKTPQPLNGGMTFTQISVNGGGAAYSSTGCAITAAADLYCWGDNKHGQLGIGSTADALTPTLVSGGRKWVQVSVGWKFVCGLTVNGEVLCWGENAAGQLGNGSVMQSTVPVLVSSALRFGEVSAGTSTACALTTAGSAYCWGSASSLGEPFGSANRLVPTATPGGLTFNRLSVGGAQCAITPANEAYCWGQGSSMGNGTTAATRTPQALSATLRFNEISNGIIDGCGKATDGTPYCWGTGTVGQLGNGVRGMVLRPTRVNLSGTVPGSAARLVPNSQTSGITWTAGASLLSQSARVIDANDLPVAGVTVTFEILDGGGSLNTSTGGVTSVTATTNAQGVASTGWRLGATPGSNTLRARAAALPADTVLITATGITPGAPATFVRSSGPNNSTFDAGITLTTAQAPAVIVRDAGGFVVPGVSVTFSHTGTARGLGAGFFSTAGAGSTDLTNADGIARPALVRVDTALTGTPRTIARTDTVTASLGSFSPVSFVFSNRPLGASRTAFLNSPPTNVGAGVSLGTIQVEVQDQYGNKVPTATSAVTLSLGTGTASLAGTNTVAAVAGIASFTGNSVGTLGSSYFLRATGLTTVGTSATFNVVSGSAAGVPSVITMIQGNNQTVPAGTIVPVAPQVRITDGEGMPMAGVTVTFVSGAPGTTAEGDGTIGSGISSRTWIVTTDASGIATVTDWQLGSEPGLNVLLATLLGTLVLTFSATGS